MALFIDGELIHKKTSNGRIFGTLPLNIRVGNDFTPTEQMNSTSENFKIYKTQKTAREALQDYIEGIASLGPYCLYEDRIARPRNTCISKNLLTAYCDSTANIVTNCTLCGGCSCPDPNNAATCFKCGAGGACYRPEPRQPIQIE